jgi:SOS-response transcriptional repressor LexA
MSPPKKPASIRKHLSALILRSGFSYQELSKRLGKNPSYIRDFIRRGTPRELHERERIKISILLHIDERELRSYVAPNNVFEENGRPEHLTSAAPSPKIESQMFTDAADLPMRGTPILESKIGAYSFMDNPPIGLALRPAILRGVTDAYCVEVADDLMEPAFRRRFVLWVHPYRAVNAGDDVIAHLRDGTSLIRNLVERSDEFVILQSFNPQRLLKFPSSEVAKLHLIIGSTRIA